MDSEGQSRKFKKGDCLEMTAFERYGVKQVFRVKKLVGLPPQLELLADSVTSQVHDNLFKLAHTESIGMHTGHGYIHMANINMYRS